jgi:C_GCAxxG_C_C family probable redox protein
MAALYTPIMKSRGDQAVETFISGFNCAQSVLSSCCPELSLDRDTALRVSSGFGGGIARRQEICGALSGGILAISLKHGRGENDDRSAIDTTYGKIRELIARFESAHGSSQCRTLLGCDLSTPEGQQFFKDNSLSATICRECVRTAADALDGIL